VPTFAPDARTVTDAVTGAPDLPKRYAAKTIRPTAVTVHIREGEIVHVTVYGQLLKKDGTPGVVSDDETFDYDRRDGRWLTGEPPAWALDWATRQLQAATREG